MKIKDSNQNVKKSICFQRKIKDFNDNLKKIIAFQRKNNNFRLQPPEDRFDDTFEKNFAQAGVRKIFREKPQVR